MLNVLYDFYFNLPIGHEYISNMGLLFANSNQLQTTLQYTYTFNVTIGHNISSDMGVIC